VPRSIPTNRRRKKNKYGAKKVEIGGYKFDSKAEGERYKYLRDIKVDDLEPHPKYDLHVNGVKIGTYSPDFQYTVNGELVVEDVKGRATLTPLYRWKKKHMLVEHGITVKEVYYNYKKKSFYTK
tara:strand:- start:245 stop:616 length:372 start_codon:yes stop_codon:yes gene_type:complete